MTEFNLQLGQNLRAERLRRGLSLQDVAEMTDDEFKSSVLGAYERGERAMTVIRLNRLCQVYGISISVVFPNERQRRLAHHPPTK